MRVNEMQRFSIILDQTIFVSVYTHSFELPPGPAVLHKVWPEGPKSSQAILCSPYHLASPAQNAFGQETKSALWPDDNKQRPLK